MKIREKNKQQKGSMILILRKTDFGDDRKVKRFTTEASEQAYRSRK